MALYTGKGDNGTTKTFGCDQRISKSSAIAEALGSLDEINSFLGLCKVKSGEVGFKIGDDNFSDIVHEIQQTLFIVQAELAGSEMSPTEEKVRHLEFLIDTAERMMPQIKTFFISGGTKLAATFDVARTIARRAERRVVQVKDEGTRPLGEFTLPYLNRLSSILYAMARLSSHLSGVGEESPKYK